MSAFTFTFIHSHAYYMQSRLDCCPSYNNYTLSNKQIDGLIDNVHILYSVYLNFNDLFDTHTFHLYV